eukprot:537646_1
MTILFVTMIRVISTISATSHSPNEAESDGRRLLTAPYVQTADSNLTTTRLETSMLVSTQSHTEMSQPTDKALPHFISSNDLLPIYLLIAILGLTQLIALCGLMLYCRKQSNTTHQIEELSLKMVHSISALPQSPSVHTLTVSSGMPPPIAIRHPKFPNHHSLPTSSPCSKDPPIDAKYGYLHPSTPVQNTGSTLQYNPVDITNAKVSISCDHDVEMSSRPWDPKTSNQTCLPPTINRNSNKALFERTVNELHPTSIKLAKAISDMDVTPLKRNVTRTQSAQTSTMTRTRTRTMDSSEDEAEEGVIPVMNLSLNGQVWDELESRNVLSKGQSGVSMVTVDSGDSVLGEMLGLNCNDR